MTHLNDAERAKYEADKAAQRAVWEPYRRERSALVLGDPACWGWPVPAAGPPVPEDQAAAVLNDWQQGRCAICATTEDLVNDHDHQTGLMRGRLCRRCNTNEGMDGRPGTVYEKYRRRPPTRILGIRLRYWDPIAKAYAEPQRMIEDGWEDNSTADLT
ncbi:endonuclease domain-containing protein [Streptomyces griseosporeus]